MIAFLISTAEFFDGLSNAPRVTHRRPAVNCRTFSAVASGSSPRPSPPPRRRGRRSPSATWWLYQKLRGGRHPARCVRQKNCFERATAFALPLLLKKGGEGGGEEALFINCPSLRLSPRSFLAGRERKNAASVLRAEHNWHPARRIRLGVRQYAAEFAHWFRAARCRPLRQPGWLPLQQPAKPAKPGARGFGLNPRPNA